MFWTGNKGIKSAIKEGDDINQNGGFPISDNSLPQAVDQPSEEKQERELDRENRRPGNNKVSVVGIVEPVNSFYNIFRNFEWRGIWK